jgi:hypothetical protein
MNILWSSLISCLRVVAYNLVFDFKLFHFYFVVYYYASQNTKNCWQSLAIAVAYTSEWNYF